MNNLSLSQLNAAVEKSINQTVLMEHFQVPLIGKKLMISIKIDEILLLILICLVISRKINPLASSFWIAQNKKRSSSNYYHQVPCKNCQFFSNNRLLKCAVHPTTVLTERALNCSDYLFQYINSSVSASVVTATVFDPQTQSWYNLRNLFENSESVWAVVPFLGPHTTPAYTLFHSKVKTDR